MKCSSLRTCAASVALFSFLIGGLAIAFAAGSSYHLLSTYKFDAAPGSTTEYFDYITVDPAARRVYLSRGTAVQVIEADSGANIGVIPGFARQHGVALAPEFQSWIHQRHRRKNHYFRFENTENRWQQSPIPTPTAWSTIRRPRTPSP